MSDNKIYDVLIVGGGFAGLTAAATLARQLHTAVVFDSRVYRNARSSSLHVFPTWDGKDPEQFRVTARSELEKYDTIQFHQTEITRVVKVTAGGFEASDAAGRTWRGRKVILASGVHEIYPDIPGYEQCWARGIYHCLFCHGYEQRGAPSAGVLAVDWIASAQMAMHMGHMASSLAKVVTIYTHGDQAVAADLRVMLRDHDEYRVDDRAISKLSLGSDPSAMVLITFADGSTKEEAFLAHSPYTKVNGGFAEQLGLKLTPMGDYEVQPPFSATSVDGVFAAGDVTTMFKVAPNAVASGSMTGAGVSARLQEEKMGSAAVF